MTADEVIDAVIAAPNAWRRRVRGVAAVEETASPVANGGPVTQLEEDSGSAAAADTGELSPTQLREARLARLEHPSVEPVNGGPIAQQEGSESPNPEQPSGDGSPQPGITVTLQDGQRITPGRAQHHEDDPGSDSPDDDPGSDDDNSDSEDGGTIHVDPRRRRRSPSRYHSMSLRELRYLARGRGLTGSFHEGRGSRRAALIDFLEDGSLTNLPGCHVRSRR